MQFELLPPVPAVQLVRRLKEIPLFRFASVDELFRISTITQQARYPEGAVVQKRGAPTEYIQVLLEGKFHIGDRHSEGRSAAPPVMLGFREVLQGTALQEEALAENESIALVMPAEEFRVLLAANIELAQGLFRMLLEHFPDAGRVFSESEIRALVTRENDDVALKTVDKVMLLQTVPIFTHATAEEIYALAAISRELPLEPDRTPWSSGAAASILVLLSGEIELTLDGGSPIIAGAGQCLGVNETFAGTSWKLSGRVGRRGKALQNRARPAVRASLGPDGLAPGDLQRRLPAMGGRRRGLWMSVTRRWRRSETLLRASLAAAVLLLSPRGLWALAEEEPQWEWNGVTRIVAIGDIHGAYDNFVAVLKNAGLVDDKLHWIGGQTHLVQNGDVMDRGPESRKAMDLLMDLQEKAEKAGGYVHCLIGNHEAMNIVGILDFVSKEEYESYVDRDSRRRRESTFDNYYDKLKRDAKEKGTEPPKKNDAKREFEDRYPLGFIEHRQAFAADGRYGKWILGHNAAIKINGIVFTHGDWSLKFSQIGIAELNRKVRSELRGESALEDGLTFDSESPLQYRGLAQTPLTRAAQQARLANVDLILGHLGAKRMVVGHTVTSGVIESRFGGKHISIDCGMLDIYHGGHRVALEIVDDRLEAIHDRGKVPIPETMDETNFEDYVRAVAAVAPDNVDVQLKIVGFLQRQNRDDDAASLLLKLFETPGRVPFRYRDELGAYYESRNEPAKAREQYLAYVEGLGVLVDANPDNGNLANLLARYCVDKNLELDRADRVLARALDRAPGTPNFLLTQARLRIAQSEFAKALAILAGLGEDKTMGYEIHYFEGLAYVGLEDEDHARRAFEQAIEAAPTRNEARDELKKLDEASVSRARETELSTLTTG